MQTIKLKLELEALSLKVGGPSGKPAVWNSGWINHRSCKMLYGFETNVANQYMVW